MDDYSRGGHSKYSMKVHIIFVTKYRKKLFISDRRADDVKQFLHDAAKRYGYTIIQMETDKDHVHYCWNIVLKYLFPISFSNSSNIVHIRCGIFMWSICLKNIGNTKYYGRMDILLAVLVKSLRRLLKNISRTKDNGNVRRVSTRLKACGFTADNL